MGRRVIATSFVTTPGYFQTLRIPLLGGRDFAETASAVRHSSSSQGYWMFVHALSQQGRHDQAHAAAQRAREIDPLDALSHSMSANIAFCARDVEAAAHHACEALLVEPNFWLAHYPATEHFDRTPDFLGD